MLRIKDVMNKIGKNCVAPMMMMLCVKSIHAIVGSCCLWFICQPKVPDVELVKEFNK
ncbi:hypothetical protein SAMN02746066_02436 [Anaerosporobacter mobilis DSM 15930]|jgi:hypothetical protein|uniref:Cyclic lactone autoinducer peptide n=1 Tax=Anaerosporobacter mobilis DSM 15930 TaxID=1120996 RepID=A0A1M7JVC3_9FIRM|nr:hypothetical protein [Anaerosporobacter mobilis]SHM57012.1 hypothetical protein SAMN02746066_02436 [Anaerosporobacter mobilis DSM 15930]